MTSLFSLWIGSQLSIYEKLTLMSAKKYDYDFTLYCYGEIKVPEGIRIADANQIIPFSEVRKINNSFASFSNRFRYKVQKCIIRLALGRLTYCFQGKIGIIWIKKPRMLAQFIYGWIFSSGSV